MVSSESEAALDVAMERLASLLPLFWRDDASARVGIRIGERNYGAAFDGDEGLVESPIMAGGELRGTVRVCLPSKGASADSREMAALAQLIGLVLERHSVQPDLPVGNLRRQSNKMSTLGEFISGVSHEIFNPLNAATMSAENLGEAWRRIEPVLEAYSDSHGSFRVGSLSLSAFREMIPELLSNISHSLRRIETMTAELERYILTGPSDKLERVDVNAAVKASLALLAGMLKRSTCALQVHYGQPMPEIRGNFQALEQVVINLVANACHALPAPRCPMIVSTEYRQESEEVIIAISDEGIGVTEEGLHRIVNPASLTARGVENGAGRGLAVVSAIVGAWGGRLEFESEAGKGTNVRVVLPAADRETPGVATETRVCGESGRS